MPSNQYSPTAEQPYQAPPPIDIVPPAPSPLAPQNPAPTGIQAQGNISHVGAAAGIADNILRGFINGKAQGQQQEALKQARAAKMYENAHNLASQNLLQMHQAGVDPNSEQYHQAKDAVDASFKALNLYTAQMIGGGPDKKPKKGSKAQAQPQTIGEMVQSKDPHVQAQGWLMLRQQSGPSVYHQIAAGDTPEAKAARKTAQTQAETGGLAATNDLNQQKDVARRNELLGKPEGQRTKAEQDELNGITERLTPIAKPRTEQPGDIAKRGLDELYDRISQDPNYTMTPRDVLTLQVNKIDPNSIKGFHFYTNGEITKIDPATGKPIEVRPAQPGFVGRGGAGRGGHVGPGGKRGTPGQFSQVEKDTHTEYQKAKDQYDTAINFIVDASANPKTAAEWTPQRIAQEKKKAYDALEERNKSIATLNTERTRALGGIPAGDEHHPAAAAHQPESPHGPPAGAEAEVFDAGGKLIGWSVKGVFQAK